MIMPHQRQVMYERVEEGLVRDIKGSAMNPRCSERCSANYTVTFLNLSNVHISSKGCMYSIPGIIADSAGLATPHYLPSG